MTTSRRLTIGLALWALVPVAASWAQGPHVTMTGVTASAAPAAEADGDGDGDELLEHWGDPKYRKEQQVQFLGMAAFFGGAGALAARRRAARRKEYRLG